MLYSVNVTEDNYKVELADVSMWLKDAGLDEDEEITAMVAITIWPYIMIHVYLTHYDSTDQPHS